MTIAAIDRALEVLLFISAAERPTTGITEIAEALDMPKAVVHRIVSSLKVRGFVVADEETRRYSLGPACLAVGVSYVDRLDLRQLAQDPMARLVELTNETATISVRDGWKRFYIDQITPDREILMSIRIGQPQPLYAGSSSKAFLAFLPTSEIEEYFENVDFVKLTEQTIVDPGKLRAELAKVRKQGYASSLGERQADAASVAAPILDRHGRPIAVMSVCGPIGRFSHAIKDTSALLVAETMRLSQYWGWVDGE